MTNRFCVCVCQSLIWVCPLQSHGLYSIRLLCPWDFPGKNTEEDCHFLLQRIFPTQGSYPSHLCCRQILYQLSHQGSPNRLIRDREQIGVSLVVQTVKNLPAMRETRVSSRVREDPLEKEMATHSSIIAWRIPWTEEPVSLQSRGSQRVTRLSDFHTSDRQVGRQIGRQIDRQIDRFTQRLSEAKTQASSCPGRVLLPSAVAESRHRRSLM